MKCLAIIAFLSAFCGCSRTVNENEISGRFEVNQNHSTDEIDVLPSGSYRYFFKNDSGIEIRNAGGWALEYESGVPRLVFSRFIFGTPLYRGRPAGIWSVEIERSWRGKIRLCLNEDLGLYYEKTDFAITIPLKSE